MKRMLVTLAVIAASLAISTCEPDASFFGLDGGLCAGNGSGPTLCVVSPTPGAQLTEFTGSDLEFNVEVAVGNFELRLPGNCPVVNNTCGHIHLFVDPYSDAGECIQTQHGNAGYIVSSDTHMTVSVGSCHPPTGQHTLLIELHNDLHGPLSPPVSVTEQFTAMPTGM